MNDDDDTDDIRVNSAKKAWDLLLAFFWTFSLYLRKICYISIHSKKCSMSYELGVLLICKIKTRKFSILQIRSGQETWNQIDTTFWMDDK